jgi:hypothetical protein
MVDRPKFKDLLEKPFLVRAALDDQIDVGMWYNIFFNKKKTFSSIKNFRNENK